MVKLSSMLISDMRKLCSLYVRLGAIHRDHIFVLNNSRRRAVQGEGSELCILAQTHSTPPVLLAVVGVGVVEVC